MYVRAKDLAAVQAHRFRNFTASPRKPARWRPVLERVAELRNSRPKPEPRVGW